MGNYQRARRLALAAACLCSGVVGVGATAAPGTAFACTLTGSGSSLQANMQTEWAKKYTGCTTPGVSYVSTSSGKGLLEFGMPGGVLAPRPPMDEFIGTDDPSNKEQLKEANTASGTNAITFPTVAAPIAVILHPPANCEPTAAEFIISNEELNKLWVGGYANWKTFLTAVVTATGFSETAKGCEVTIKKEVRSDSSGTSFAFKQYLSQIEPSAWLKASGAPKEFVTDAPEWPTGTAALTTHGAGVANEGSGGEVAAVAAETGSVGYVNLANAVSGAFVKYAAKGTKFWARVRNAGAKGEPISATGEKGNCPASLTTALTAAQEKEAKGEAPEGTFGPVWATIHLANTATLTIYPLCTLTYDVGWESYTTTNLEAAAIYNGKGAELGPQIKGYSEFMPAAAGQKVVSETKYYSELPEQIDTIAKADSKKVG